MSEVSIAHAGRLLREASSVLALTGAGISAESGVPTFRGADGLWQRYRVEDLATPGAFARDPATVWAWYRWRRDRVAAARPNAGHETLARLEQRRGGFVLVTQNVDGLHRQAGNTRVHELHGNIWRTVCSRRCGVVIDESPWVDAPAAPPARPDGLPVCRCGALLRPDVVWFGESLNPEVLGAAIEAAGSADVVLVVGTSSLVYPAAALPGVAKRSGAVVIEVNVEATPLSAEADIVLRGPASVVLPELERAP